MKNVNKITRIVIIGINGIEHEVHNTEQRNFEMDIQDDGRTVKFFEKPSKETFMCSRCTNVYYMDQFSFKHINPMGVGVKGISILSFCKKCVSEHTELKRRKFRYENGLEHKELTKNV